MEIRREDIYIPITVRSLINYDQGICLGSLLLYVWTSSYWFQLDNEVIF